MKNISIVCLQVMCECVSVCVCDVLCVCVYVYAMSYIDFIFSMKISLR